MLTKGLTLCAMGTIYNHLSGWLLPARFIFAKYLNCFVEVIAGLAEDRVGLVEESGGRIKLRGLASVKRIVATRNRDYQQNV